MRSKQRYLKPDAMLVMLAERVHGDPPGRQTSQRIAKGRLRERLIMQGYHQLDIWQRAMSYVDSSLTTDRDIKGEVLGKPIIGSQTGILYSVSWLTRLSDQRRRRDHRVR